MRRCRNVPTSLRWWLVDKDDRLFPPTALREIPASNQIGCGEAVAQLHPMFNTGRDAAQRQLQHP